MQLSSKGSILWGWKKRWIMATSLLPAWKFEMETKESWWTKKIYTTKLYLCDHGLPVHIEDLLPLFDQWVSFPPFMNRGLFWFGFLKYHEWYNTEIRVKYLIILCIVPRKDLKALYKHELSDPELIRVNGNFPRGAKSGPQSLKLSWELK